MERNDKDLDGDLAISGRPEDRVFRQVIANYDAPAYIRRARQVEDALVELVARCRAQRDEWLKMVRIDLGMLHGLAGEWQRLQPWLAADDQVGVLESLDAELRPALRVHVERTTSGRKLRRALRDVIESLEHFNRRWSEYLLGVDLSPVNTLREGYNRYYVLEKECAVRSSRIARQGFHRLEPLTQAELSALVPLLPVPQLKIAKRIGSWETMKSGKNFDCTLAHVEVDSWMILPR